MSENKPIASLSLDLDNLWSYMKTHGDAGWETFPSYLDVVVPRILEFLEKRDLKITFMIVGQDAALEKNFSVIQSIAEAGHEIGNHSFNHEPWLHLYSEKQIEEEISRTEVHIQRVTGEHPVGFRGPGYSLSASVLQILSRHGYRYDASTFPSFLGPLARAYYFMTTKLPSDEKELRKQLFGGFKDGFQPLRPYCWQIESGHAKIIEIPVTTLPIFKIPFHVSYLLYISRFSKWLARFYFKSALALCRITRTPPSLLLHPLDFLGSEDVRELSFFPGMDLTSGVKIKLVSDFLEIFSTLFTVVPIQQQVDMLCQGSEALSSLPFQR
jgi:peptidoglycan/xylan/chitin deacetylase (PgdA/CDA1 family)